MVSWVRHKIRNIFLAGLVVILPIAFTLFILTWIFKKLDNLSPFITNLLIYFGAPLPKGFKIPGLGIATTVLIIFLVGIFTTSVIGKKVLVLWEYILNKIPFIRGIYGAIKQIIETITIRKNAFNQVVMIEYPRKGLYCLGLLTCESKGEIQNKTEKEIMNVFIPTTPNPTSGFLLFVPKESIIPLSMSVEEGLKLIISGGIVTPFNEIDSQKLKENYFYEDKK